MDEATRSAWIDFMKGAGGKDLLGRFIANEQTFIAAAMKNETVEGKALAMAKMEAIYRFREGILDIVKPKVASSGSTASNRSK